MLPRLFLAALLLFLALPARAQQGAEAALSQHASAGTLPAGVVELSRLAAAAPQDPQARMAMGFAQFAVAVEKLGQGFYRHGSQSPGGVMLPVLRLPVPSNPAAEKLDIEKLRAIYQGFLDDLAKADTTLAAVPEGPVKLVVNLNAVHLDFDRNGQGDAYEGLGTILAHLSNRTETGPWEVAFDRADIYWLRGYIHVLSSLVEFALAHDWKQSYDVAGHLFFRGAMDPANPLHAEAASSPLTGRDQGRIADLVAMVHAVRWPVREPARLVSVHGHLKQVVELSRANWREILAETDDDREWVPSPAQNSRAVQALPVGREQAEGWATVIDRLDQMLDGKLLIGHWRFEKGIDLRDVLLKPQTFDLVQWVTGHAAVPYLKEGPVLGGPEARELTRAFGNNFIAFALWFN